MAQRLNHRRRNRELQAIAFEFHQRAFGEELARVNFLPVAERKAYLARVRKRAGQACPKH